MELNEYLKSKTRFHLGFNAGAQIPAGDRARLEEAMALIPDEYWSGNGWDDTEALWEQSPLKHFRNVRTPTLVIHSEGDLRCNVEQGEQVFAALKLLKVPTRFIRYPTTTSHGMSRMGPPDLRIHRLDQIVKWWQTYLD